MEQGLLLVGVGFQSMVEGDAAATYATFNRAGAIGDRFGDPDLVAFGRLRRGLGLLALGETTQGVASLDEAAVAVTAEQVSPVTVGVELRRAQEWTAALSRWCPSRPDLVPYRGQCLVHRAEIRQLHGEWPDAEQEAQRARKRLSGHPGCRPGPPRERGAPPAG